HALEVRRIERRPRSRSHLRRLAGDSRDRIDRMAEQVAVVESRPTAEDAHLLAELWLDERVDHDRGPSLRALDGEPEVVDGLDARVPNLPELLVGKLRLERVHEPRRRLAGRVRDGVQLNGRLVFPHGAEGTAALRTAHRRRT